MKNIFTSSIIYLAVSSHLPAAILYQQDFSGTPITDFFIGDTDSHVASDSGTINGGTSTTLDGDYSVNWSLASGAATRFTINTTNSTGTISDGIGAQSDAEFLFQTVSITTNFGNLIIRVQSVNNTEDDVYLQEVSVDQTATELDFTIEFASDQADLGVRPGGEGLFVSYQLGTSGFISLGDPLDDFPSAGNTAIPEGTSKTFKLVPEPSSVLLFGIAVCSSLMIRRRK